MSSPADKNDDPSAYAPKWVRETPRIAEGEFLQRNEQLVPRRGQISDQERPEGVLGTVSVRAAQFAPRARTPLAKGGESKSYHVPRAPEPQLVSQPPVGASATAPKALGRLAALGGLVVAASLGA